MAYWMTPMLGAAAGCWTLSGAMAIVDSLRGGRGDGWRRTGWAMALLGVLIVAGMMIVLWTTLDRPPMRTLGETRLWYALLLPAIGVALEWRLKTTALRLPMLFFGVLFVLINLSRPDALDKTLMPALQSPWFVPHVVVYMVAYAALGLSCGVAVWNLIRGLWFRRASNSQDLWLPGVLVRLGLPFLTFGLLFGALWAKEAWGHYWSWDPKETWAFLTWAAYLGVLHVEYSHSLSPRRTLLLYIGAFGVVLGCWFLVNLLPAAQVSVHTYTQQ